MGELLRNGRWSSTRVSADRGDANAAIVYGSDEPVQRFATALTGVRTVTINNNDSDGKPVPNGAMFRVTRPATGASALNVQDSTPTLIKVIAAGQWADFIVNDQGVWMEAAFGSL